MKLSDKPHIKAKIEKFKSDVAMAHVKDIQILPSIRGPYAYKGGRVLGVKGTKTYNEAIS